MLSIEYFAGIVDGEGHIAVRKNNTSFQSVFVVVNTNWTLIKALNNQFGGTIEPRTRKNKKHKNTWALAWYGDAAKNMLEKVLPHLIVKKEIALAVLEFEVYRQSLPRTWKGKEWKIKSIHHYQVSRQLNKTGT